jgi:hypothetical protein
MTCALIFESLFFGFNKPGMKDACEEPELRDEDPPTLVSTNGTKVWGIFSEGCAQTLTGIMESFPGLVFHRVNGPAVIRADGTQEWWRYGRLHRENDEPAVIGANGRQIWYQNGWHHRVDGPAIVCPSGYTAWFRNGRLHRESGPAITRADGTQDWWQNDWPI